MKCEWEDLEHIEWILDGIVRSKVMYYPKGILKRLKKEFSVCPEELRKRRIIKLDDDAAMHNFLAEREIKRKDYVSAAQHLREYINLQAHLLFPLNVEYFLTKKNLLDRVNQLNKVPKGFCELSMTILFGLKPDEGSMNLALKSSVKMLEDLQKNFDYLKYRKEFPAWASKKP